MSVIRLGSDVGNDAVKVNLENGKTEEVMNVISLGYDRRIKGEEKGELVNLLDVDVYECSTKEKHLGRYFVGGLAFKEAKGDILERSKTDIKADSIETVILNLTAIAYTLYDPSNPRKTENIEMGTTLPTEEYFSDLAKGYIQQYRDKTYRIKFNSEAFKGAEITLIFQKAHLESEGIAATYAYQYEIDGAIKDGMEDFEYETHLGVDIGSITTDVTITDNGEIDENKGVFGIPKGMAEPLDRIIGELYSKYKLEITRHQLDYLIRKDKTFKYNNGEKIVDLTSEIKELKEIHYQNFAKVLVNNIYKKLDSNGIDTKVIHRVNMSGGGAITLIDAIKKEFRQANVHLVDNARFANAKGALISMILDAQAEERASAEVFSK